jgi:hypothetical protein
MTAYESQGKSEERMKRLLERREKLASLLAEERDMYEVIRSASASLLDAFSILMLLARVQGFFIEQTGAHEAQVPLDCLWVVGCVQSIPPFMQS